MITTFEQLPSVRETHTNQTIAFKSGCYDLVHEGHVSGLEFAKDQADILVVGVRPDIRVAQKKGPCRPIRGEVSRLAVIGAMRMVDYAFVMPHTPEVGDSPFRVIEALRPDVFIVPGAEQVPPHPYDELMRATGVELIFDDNPAINSTTAIIERVFLTHRHLDSQTA